MQRFRRILVAVETGKPAPTGGFPLSGPSREAFQRALWLAGCNSAELTILTVVDLSTQASDLLVGRFEDAIGAAENEAEQAVGELVRRAEEGGINVTGRVARGTPWVEIIRQVLRGGQDLVVAGTRNRGRTGRLLFGSTGLKLLHHSPCPVWITKPSHDDKEADQDRPLNVLVASGLDDVSLDALQMAVNLGQLVDTRTHLLHAVEHDLDSRFWQASISAGELEDYRRKLLNDAEHALHEQLAQTDYRTLKYGVLLHVVEGPADTCILDAVEEHAIDLVVMGTVGRSGVSRVIVGNTAERLLPGLPCSVLAVKPEGFVSRVTLADDESE